MVGGWRKEKGLLLKVVGLEECSEVIYAQDGEMYYQWTSKKKNVARVVMVAACCPGIVSYG